VLLFYYFMHGKAHYFRAVIMEVRALHKNLN